MGICIMLIFLSFALGMWFMDRISRQWEEKLILNLYQLLVDCHIDAVHFMGKLMERLKD